MAQAIVQRSRAKLRSAIGDEKNMMCSKFGGDLREMLKVLEVIEPVLEDAERHSLWDEVAREWLRRVRNAAYSISDMLDEMQDTTPRTIAGISIVHVVPQNRSMSNKMKETKLELIMLQGSHRFASAPETLGQKPWSPYRFPPLHLKPAPEELMPPTPDIPMPPPPRRPMRPPPPLPLMPSPPRPTKPPPPLPIGYLPTHLLPVFTPPSPVKLFRARGRIAHRKANEQSIVGRGENKQIIMATLSATDITEGPIILPIFGLAAIGKTTLAEMVFNDTGFGEYKSRVWVDVTPKFDLLKIGKHILCRILHDINLATENKSGRCQDLEQDINSDADTDTDTDESSQESEEFNLTISNVQKVQETGEVSDGDFHVSKGEINKSSDGYFQIPEDEEINQATHRTTGVSEEDINRSSDEASQVSEDETKKGSEGTSQISEDEINQATYRTSQESEELNKGLGGVSQLSDYVIDKDSVTSSKVLEDEIIKGSDTASQESDDDINKGSNGTSRVLAHEINKGRYETSQVGASEDQEINNGIDATSQESEEICQLIKNITQCTDGTSIVLEDVSHGSHEIYEISDKESNTGSDVTSQVGASEDQEIDNGIDASSQESLDVSLSSHEIYQTLEEENNYGSSDVTSQVSPGINQLSNEIYQLTRKGIRQDVDRITERLHEVLNGMEVLIVLDDLWEENSNELGQLKHMLGVGIKGSKASVIVTTCNEGIARKICTVKPYKLDPLTNDMCWTIIKQQSDFEDRPDSDKPELERIGRHIASKCGGLPLAAQELGYSLRHQDARLRWEDAMKSDIWSHILTDNGIVRSFELSYSSMPPDLRLCFAYCAIFPQGDNMVKDDIIHQWIALGLVDPSETLSMTQVAEEYIRRLLDISFLQTAGSASSTSGNGDKGAILLSMHELAHALARSVGDELIVLDDGMGTSYQNKFCRYALLTEFGMKLSSRLPTQLRALRCVGCSKMDLGDDAFSFARCLRVLHLNECSMQKLPDSICQLRQLGYLNLSGCSRLVTLPESFGGLLNLWYINLSRCYGLAELPESFGKLKKLVHLDLSFWCCFEGIPVLGGLTSLQHLNLSHPCCYRAQHLPHLEGLKDVLCKLTNLQYLNLSMCMNPIFCYLTEEQCREYIRSCTSGLSSLKHLDLSHNIFLIGIPESLGELQNLHTLDLTGCIRLKTVAKRICERDSLKLIVIKDCRGLESCSFVVHIDDGGFSSNLAQLEHVNCQDLEISCLEQVKSIEEANRVRLLEKRKLQKLTLCWTVGSQGFVEDDANLLAELEPPHDLQHLELHGYRATCFPAWSSSISSHLPNLMEVTMEDFPRCRSLPPFALLPNLRRLVLRRMASITRIDVGELSGGHTAAAVLRRLSNFTIDDMESLEEFNTTYYSGSGEELCMFPAVDELVIQKCSKLSFRSLPPRARRLVISDCTQVLSSSRLLVSDCDQVVALHMNTAAGGGGVVEGPCITSAPIAELVIHGCIADWSLLRYLAGLQMLSISHCEGMTSLPQDMGHLNSLHDLQIVCCKQLKRFPDSMQNLTSLRSLHFAECDSIKKLPKWFGCLTSLQKLSIHKCHAFKSLPRSIKGLNNLKDLHISECRRLMNWCQLKKDKEKKEDDKKEEDKKKKLEDKRKKLEHTQPKYGGDTSEQMRTWDYFFSNSDVPFR